MIGRPRPHPHPRPRRGRSRVDQDSGSGVLSPGGSSLAWSPEDEAGIWFLYWTVFLLFLCRLFFPDHVSLSGISFGHIRILSRETKIGASWGLSTKRTLAFVGVNSSKDRGMVWRISTLYLVHLLAYGQRLYRQHGISSVLLSDHIAASVSSVIGRCSVGPFPKRQRGYRQGLS